MTTWTIRPRHIGPELSIETMRGSLKEAAERFCQVVGLGCFEQKIETDDQGHEYMTFKVGTGSSFVIFKKLEG